MDRPAKSLCEEAEFDVFFRKESKSLLHYLYYRFGDKALAQDMAQDAFVKLWKKCADVPLEKARGFLYTVATNLSTSAKRHGQVKLKYQEMALKTDSEKDNQSPEYVMLEKEFMDKLTSAIAALPERQRMAYLLNRVEKKTYREIAEMMEISVKAVEKLMHKALQKLRQQIGEI